MPFGIGALFDNPGFYVLDLETNGMRPEVDKIIEIGIVHVSPEGKLDKEWQTLVNPGEGIDVGATHVHGITLPMIKDAPSFEDIAPFVYKMIAGAPLVAHNTSFDVPFLTKAFQNAGLHTFGDPLPAIDTIVLAKKYLTLPHYKLGVIAEHLGIDLENAHCALDDARAAAEMFAYFIKKDPKQYFEEIDVAQNMVWDVPDEVLEPKILVR
ncbi:MAG: 3'-5' exonuclease [Coriobacteriia bacterium]|nr:3'-5' exonuclease [Coriobacteriia bacterium]